MPAKHIPSGLLAVASGLSGVPQTSEWLDQVGEVAGISFRMPAASEAVAIACLRLIRSRTPWLAVHGRADWAKLVEADALIEGWRALPATALAPHFDTLRLRSTHSLEEVAQAHADGISAVIFGPIWDTPSKRDLVATRSLSELQLATQVGPKVIAIAGINSAERVQSCLAKGAHAVAVLGAAKKAQQLISQV